MHLQLTRPLAFIDLETTGINISVDRVVEIAIVKIMPDGTKQVKRKLISHIINPLIMPSTTATSQLVSLRHPPPPPALPGKTSHPSNRHQ